MRVTQTKTKMFWGPRIGVFFNRWGIEYRLFSRGDLRTSSTLARPTLRHPLVNDIPVHFDELDGWDNVALGAEMCRRRGQKAPFVVKSFFSFSDRGTVQCSQFRMTFLSRHVSDYKLPGEAEPDIRRRLTNLASEVVIL